MDVRTVRLVRTVGQAVRIVVLVGLLIPVELLRRSLMGHTDRMDLAAAALPWVGLLVLGVLFIAVVLFRRGRDESRVLLVVEALVAAVIAMAPWVLSGPSWGRTEALLVLSMRSTATGGFVAALAIAWLVIVIRRLGEGRRVTA